MGTKEGKRQKDDRKINWNENRIYLHIHSSTQRSQNQRGIKHYDKSGKNSIVLQTKIKYQWNTTDDFWNHDHILFKGI